jgi:hypothetical protein
MAHMNTFHFGYSAKINKCVNIFELERVSNLSKSTILKLCYNQEYRPRFSTIIKINQGLKKLGKEIDINEFFS